MPDGHDESEELSELLGRLASLLEQVDEFDEGPRDTVYATLDATDDLHRFCLRRLGDAFDDDTLTTVRESHPALAWLFDAYGVGSDQFRAVQAALDEVRPSLESRGGQAELIGVTDGVVRLRLGGAFNGTPDAPSLHADLERAFTEQVPGFVRIVAEELQEQEAPAAPPSQRTLLQIQPPPSRRDGNGQRSRDE